MKEREYITNDMAIKALEKEFVPYHIAKKMMELGFDEPCFAHYTDAFAGHEFYLIIGSIVKHQEQYHRQICSAPLWQQAIDWLKRREGSTDDQYKSFDETLTRILNIKKNETGSKEKNKTL